MSETDEKVSKTDNPESKTDNTVSKTDIAVSQLRQDITVSKTDITVSKTDITRDTLCRDQTMIEKREKKKNDRGQPGPGTHISGQRCHGLQSVQVNEHTNDTRISFYRMPSKCLFHFVVALLK